MGFDDNSLCAWSTTASLWIATAILAAASSFANAAPAPRPSYVAGIALRTDEGREQYADRLSIARTAYFKVITSNSRASDKAAHEALAALEQAYPGDPVAKAYRGSLQLLDAAHNWAIWNLHKQANEGLTLLDEAVAEGPNEPEARFIRAATSWHLPGFYRRKPQCEADFALLSGRAEEDARRGKLPPELAAATFNYWGQILVDRKDSVGAHAAFSTAVRIAAQSPGGLDAGRRLRALEVIR